MLVEGRHFFPAPIPKRSATRRSRSTCRTWRRWARRRAGRCWRARCPTSTTRGSRRSRAVFSRWRTSTASISSAATRRAVRAISASRSLGEVPAGQALPRAGATRGDDDLGVRHAGRRGAGARALERADRRSTPTTLQRARARSSAPAPRVALGQALRGIASARSMCPTASSAISATCSSASQVGAVVDLAALPRSAALERQLARRRARPRAAMPAGRRRRLRALLHGAAGARCAIAALGASSGLPLTRIGAIIARRGLVVRDEQGAHDSRAAARVRPFRAATRRR